MAVQRHQELLRVAIAAHEALPLICEFIDEPEIQRLAAADKALHETENDLMASHLMEGGSYKAQTNWKGTI